MSNPLASIPLSNDKLQETVSNGSVDADVDSLFKLLGCLGGESIIVENAAELEPSSLKRLYHSECLDGWLIAAAMEPTDKPSCVRYGVGIPLDEEKDGKTIPATKPFDRCKKKRAED